MVFPDGSTATSCADAPAGDDPANECGGYTCDGGGGCFSGCSAGGDECKLPTHACIDGACVLERPRQQATAAALADELPLVVDTQGPTLPGNTLVLVVALGAVTESVDQVVDSAGNNWQVYARAAPSESAYPVTEIWASSVAQPITSLTVSATDPSRLVGHLTEWTGLDPLVDAASENPGAISEVASSGAIAVAQPSDLVIGAVSIYSGTSATLEDSGGFTQLLSPPVADYLKSWSAYRIGGPATYEAVWALGRAVNYTGAGIAIPLR